MKYKTTRNQSNKISANTREEMKKGKNPRRSKTRNERAIKISLAS
jgi:hypothetical protein